MELRDFPYGDPSVGLDSGAVDIGFMRPPLSATGLAFEPLFTDPLAIAVSKDHPLAARTSVRVEEILDEPLVRPLSEDPTWTSFWLPNDYRDGRPAPTAPQPSARLLEELETVAAGQASLITAMTAARYAARPGVAFVPISDAAGSVIALAFPEEGASPAALAFLDVTREVLAEQAELVGQLEGTAPASA